MIFAAVTAVAHTHRMTTLCLKNVHGGQLDSNDTRPLPISLELELRGPGELTQTLLDEISDAIGSQYYIEQQRGNIFISREKG